MNIGALVKAATDALLPGWTVTHELVPSVEANHGALAMVWPTPERQIAHITIAPHPPGESIAESVWHELTHAAISPLVKLIESSPAAVMVEEPIVERIGKLLAKLPVGLARAMISAMHNPRTRSAAVRARISALATRRRIEGRKRMDPKKLAALAMKAGELKAMDGMPPEAVTLFEELIAAAAGGSDEPPQSQNEPHVTGRDPAEGEDMDEGQYRGDGFGDAGGQMRGQRARAPQKEIEKTLIRARHAEQKARGAARGAAQITIRARVKELRSEGVTIDDSTAQKLVALGDVDAAEERISYLLKGRDTSAQRARSGARPSDDQGDLGNALKYEDLIAEKIPPQQARDLVELSKANRSAANAELAGARLRLQQIAAAEADAAARARQNGGAR